MLRLIGLLVVLAGLAVAGHWLLVQGATAQGTAARLAAGTCAACH
jgi:cytochrome c553